MNNSDKLIDQIAIKILGLDAEEAADVTRIIIDTKRGEKLSKIRVYWNNLGAKETFDLLPMANGIYKLEEVEGEGKS